jgi:type IV secretion system protein TrbH
MRVQTALTITAILLAGCQNMEAISSERSGPAGLSDAAAGAIAGDLASRFAELAGPVKDPIILAGEQSGFATSLQSALNGWGFETVSSKEGAKDRRTILLGYSIGTVEGKLLARLTTDKLGLARAYDATPAGAEPSSPLSVMHSD